MDNEESWRRLAKLVKERRDQRSWTQLDLVNRSGLSLDRVQAIEAARTDRYSTRTLAKLERGLEWEAGSVRQILGGGDPRPVEGDRQPAGRGDDERTVMAELADEVERDPELARMVLEIYRRGYQAGLEGRGEPERTDPDDPGNERDTA